jgi:hypothetical protein
LSFEHYGFPTDTKVTTFTPAQTFQQTSDLLPEVNLSPKKFMNVSGSAFTENTDEFINQLQNDGLECCLTLRKQETGHT